jgi:hypothetical protein
VSLTDGTIVFISTLESPLLSRVTLEFAPNPAGPWSAVAPFGEAAVLFVRVRVKD